MGAGFRKTGLCTTCMIDLAIGLLYIPRPPRCNILRILEDETIQCFPNEDGSGRCRPDYEGRRVGLKDYDEGAWGLEISMNNS
jgi:hypothetical protein